MESIILEQPFPRYPKPDFPLKLRIQNFLLKHVWYGAKFYIGKIMVAEKIRCTHDQDLLLKCLKKSIYSIFGWVPSPSFCAFFLSN